jgi:hypothetical protein
MIAWATLVEVGNLLCLLPDLVAQHTIEHRRGFNAHRAEALGLNTATLHTCFLGKDGCAHADKKYD